MLMYYFAPVIMKGSKRIYSFRQLFSAVFMILALLWLTVSAPFVYSSQQQIAALHDISDTTSPLDGGEEEAANPFGNTTEEKKPSGGNSFSEEYLHHHHFDENFFSVISSSHQSETAGVYTAFHGEVQVPPPNKA